MLVRSGVLAAAGLRLNSTRLVAAAAAAAGGGSAAAAAKGSSGGCDLAEREFRLLHSRMWTCAIDALF